MRRLDAAMCICLGLFGLNGIALCVAAIQGENPWYLWIASVDLALCICGVAVILEKKEG